MSLTDLLPGKRGGAGVRGGQPGHGPGGLEARGQTNLCRGRQGDQDDLMLSDKS